MQRVLSRLFALLCLCGALALPLAAQTNTGTITGEVNDANKAVIAGARVSVTNLATNFRQEVVTTGAGVFSIPSLPPGALFALHYDDAAPPLRAIACGVVHALDTIVEARFLRLTTLAVAPALRRRAFSAQFDAQVRANMLSPQTTTIAHLHAFAAQRLAAGSPE